MTVSTWSWAFIALALLYIKTVAGSVFIYSLASNDSGLVKIAPSLSTRMGPRLPLNGLRGLAFVANPIDGCKTMDLPPRNVTFQDTSQPKWLALISRYNCSFDLKLQNAQVAGYDGVVFYSNILELDEMRESNEGNINISSLIIDENAGHMIIENFQYTKGFVVVLSDNYYENLYSLVLLFVMICLFYLTIKMVTSLAKCMIGAYQRAFRRYHLQWNILRRLETRKFKKNEPADACVICLDDYEEGNELRILPCKHTFHSVCIDQWLLNNLRCPFCNFSLKPGNLNFVEASV